ncbi:RNA polymerase factor sigma-54 [Helicovermis profundi]|uniref:RNA polymerase factor sigma-54 n=1 Tax=Helicovermis profundi TaxID=3065157 RepID=A0AAU9EBP3_9FIRM|nr:RNA polymerase factor sigma-54 [Clostridia bacterium S502]
MKMNFSLNLVQTQKLVMTPELRQSIEMLQYSSLELNEYIKEELLNNPILSKDEVLKVDSEKNEISEEKKINDKENDNQDNESKEEYSVENEIDWKSLANDFSSDRFKKVNYEVKDEVSYDNFIASEETLNEHLLFQLQLTVLSNRYKEVAKYIIENIDTNGYLDISSDEVKEIYGVSDDEIEEIINTIQTFEPLGVASRTLEECLLIQSRVKYEDDLIIKAIIKNHLENLGCNRISIIAKALGEPITCVQDACDKIKKLEPKPGRSYSSLKDVKYVTPDVIINKVDNEYVIVVSDTSAPKLYINKFYSSLLNQNLNDSTTAYIKEKLNAALKIIKNIEQRRNTIYRVVKSILDYQLDFFEKGPMYLRTLTLKDIADEIEVHESTVSRAISGKYMQCPNGLFEIKYFFQSGVSSSFGEGVSSESIKMIIKEMINKENSNKPISDQFISNELNELGIKVSRRTIAKYRDELGILSSSKRKRY